MPANIAQRGASQARSQPPYLFVTRKMGLAVPTSPNGHYPDADAELERIAAKWGHA